MRTLILGLILSISTSSFAWTSKDSDQKEYVFKYKLAMEQFEVRRPASSYQEAYEQAAQDCFNHFKGSGPINENRGMDIIDACANPRS